MICFFALSTLVQYRTKGTNRSNVMKDSLAFPNAQGSYFWWCGLYDKALKERIRAGLISCQFCWTCSSIVLFNWISWTKIIITSNADYESINEKQIKLTMKASITIYRRCVLLALSLAADLIGWERATSIRKRGAGKLETILQNQWFLSEAIWKLLCFT